MVPTLVHSQSSPVFARHDGLQLDPNKSLSRSFTTGVGVGAGGEIDDTQPVQTQTYKGFSEVFTSNICLSQSQTRSQEKGRPQEDEDVVSDGEVTDSSMLLFKKSQLSQRAGSRFPETPVMAGRKRNAAGHVLDTTGGTTITKTPNSALVAMFGANAKAANGFSLTQIFEGTQAPSSPAPQIPHSDAVFQRPSPGIVMRQNWSPPAFVGGTPPYFESQDLAESSLPILQVAPTMPVIQTRLLSDPIEVYRPMDESQKSRERKADALAAGAGTTQESDGFGDSLGTQQRQLVTRQEKERLVRDALGDCASLKAPARKNANKSKRATSETRKTINLVTPHVKKTLNRSARATSENLNALSEISDDEQDAVTPTIQIPMTSSKPMDRSSGHRPSSPCLRTQPAEMDTTGSPKELRGHELLDPPVVSATQKTEPIVDSQGERLLDSLLATTADESSVISGPRIHDSEMARKVAMKMKVRTGVFAPISSSSIPHPPISPLSSQKAAITSSPPVLARAMSSNESDDEMEDVEQTSLLAPVSPPESRTSRSGRQDKSNSNGRTNSTVGRYVTANNRITEDTDKLAQGHVTEITSLSKDGPTEMAITGIEPELPEPVFDIDLDSINVLDDDDMTFNKLVEHSSPTRRSGASLSGSSPVRPAKRRRFDPSPRKRTSPLKLIQSSTNDQVPASTARSILDVGDTGHNTTPNLEPMSTDPLCKEEPEKFNHRRRISYDHESGPLKASGKLKAPKSKTFATKEWQTRKRGGFDTYDVTSTIKTTQESAESPNPATPKTSLPALADEPLGGAETKSREVRYPQRVLALWRSGLMGHYPATYMGSSRTDSRSHRVQFDDGTIAQLDIDQIGAFDLRKGDMVRADVPEIRGKTCVIESFTNIIDDESLGQAFTPADGVQIIPTDVYGHQTVMLSIKSTGKKGGKAEQPPLAVRVDALWIPRMLWPKVSDRDRSFLRSAGASQSRLHTPIVSTTERGTPLSRSRRRLPVEVVAPVKQITISPLKLPRKSSGILANMAFAITLAGNLEKEKSRCIQLLHENGATLIESGFEELFESLASRRKSAQEDEDLGDDHDDAMRDSSSPEVTKPTLGRNAASTVVLPSPEHHAGLVLTPASKKLGLVALLADKHSRRAKFMQALALDIPCLHYRWLQDSILAGAALPIAKYMLPAGESEFLYGAVRSRTIPSALSQNLSEAASSGPRFEDLFSNKGALIRDKNVLLVTGNKKGAALRGNTYEFLSYAMGAASVTCVNSLADAQGLISASTAQGKSRRGVTQLPGFDWVHVDGGEGAARRVLLERKAAKNGNKQKSRTSAPDDGMGSEILEHVPRVVGDEYVIQSLILGALL